jgi:hypothetical protein
VFKQGVKDLCNRKQLFNIVIREQDERKPLIVKLLVSNFMDGCRATLGNSDQRTVTEPMEDMITPIASELLDRAYATPHLGGAMVNVLDSYFPSAYRNGLIGKLDISDLILASVNNKGTKAFSDPQVMMAFWWRMKRNFSQSRLLVVNPRRMNYWEDEREYQSAAMTRLYVRRILDSSLSLAGTEVIVQEGSVYHHYWTIYSGAIVHTPQTTSLDVYHVQNYSSEPYVRINISTIKGYLCIIGPGGHVLDVVCLAEPECRSTIRLYTNGTILARPDTLKRLDILSEAEVSASRRVKFYYQFYESMIPESDNQPDVSKRDEDEPFGGDHELELEKLGERQLEDLMEEVAEEENSLVDDIDFFAELENLGGGSTNFSNRNRESAAPIMPEPPAEEDSEDEIEVESRRTPLGSAVTRSSAYVQRLDLAGILVSNEFTVSNEMVGKTWKTIFSLSIPVEGYDLEFTSDDQVEPVEKAIHELSSRGDAESRWVLSYFKDSLRMNRTFSVSVRNFGFR